MIEIRIPINVELAQQLEDFFCEEYQQRWMLEENWLTKEHFLHGYFETQEDQISEVAAIRKQFPGLSTDEKVSELLDCDWKEAYKLHFKPWSERGLHWVPVWERENYALPVGEEIVYLDPGMAFGTGNHETTRLCVKRLLDARDAWGEAVSNKRVIDGGCGSGILAISARKIGFKDVYGFDLDPESVRISLDNEKLCEVEGSIKFIWADLKEGLKNETGDLLLVNILSNVLCDHAELLCRSVRPGGWLVLSGILASEAQGVHEVFEGVIGNQIGTTPEKDGRIEGDWADLCYKL